MLTDAQISKTLSRPGADAVLDKILADAEAANRDARDLLAEREREDPERWDGQS